MALKWIHATSAEVQIIGDACLLGGCTLLPLTRYLCCCLAAGCVDSLQGPNSASPAMAAEQTGREEVYPCVAQLWCLLSSVLPHGHTGQFGTS